MKLRRVICTAVVIVMLASVVGTFAAELYEQQQFRCSYIYRQEFTVSSLAGLNAVTINQYTQLALSPAFSMSTSPPSQTYLNHTTRSEIFNYIGQNPGVQFRAIAAALCLPLGLAEYHIAVLVKTGLVSFIRDGRYKRFFIARKYSKTDMAAISLLRHRTAKRIIEVLLHKKELSHSRLADEVSISSQALTWQMKTLRGKQFVLEVNDGLKTIYSLDQDNAPVLVKYLSALE